MLETYIQWPPCSSTYGQTDRYISTLRFRGLTIHEMNLDIRHHLIRIIIIIIIITTIIIIILTNSRNKSNMNNQFNRSNRRSSYFRILLVVLLIGNCHGFLNTFHNSFKTYSDHSPHSISNYVARARANVNSNPLSKLEMKLIPDELSMGSIIRSGGSVLQTLDATLTPANYFICLMAAGAGIPVSEDALCIYAGSTLGNLPTMSIRIKLILFLYAGVVLSDISTFLIGKGLRRGSSGILKLIRDRVVPVPISSDGSEAVNEQDCIINVNDDGTIEVGEACIEKLSKRRMIEKKIADAGDKIGLVIRFSVGMRAPLMLLTGFSNQVSTLKYAVGVMIGAIGSLALQLMVGISLRNNPKATAAIVGSVVSWFLLSPFVFYFMSMKSGKAKNQTQ